MNVDFIFDFASPNAYLCFKAIPEIEKNTDLRFQYVPCLLGGIFKLTNNQAPMIAFNEVPHKMKYEFDTAFNRFIDKHKITNFKMNEHFPVNTLLLQRGAIVAQSNGCFELFLEVVMKAMWEESIKLDNPEVLYDLLKSNNCHADLIIEQLSSDAVKSQLVENTNAAVQKGAFGVPTFFIGEQIFFGKESLLEMQCL